MEKYHYKNKTFNFSKLNCIKEYAEVWLANKFFVSRFNSILYLTTLSFLIALTISISTSESFIETFVMIPFVTVVSWRVYEINRLEYKDRLVMKKKIFKKKAFKDLCFSCPKDKKMPNLLNDQSSFNIFFGRCLSTLEKYLDDGYTLQFTTHRSIINSLIKIVQKKNKKRIERGLPEIEISVRLATPKLHPKAYISLSSIEAFEKKEQNNELFFKYATMSKEYALFLPWETYKTELDKINWKSIKKVSTQSNQSLPKLLEIKKFYSIKIEKKKQ